MSSFTDSFAPEIPAGEPRLEVVLEKLKTMRYGSIHLSVHEGRVTFVEATEKTRLPSEPAARTNRK
jgi:hypothetical protein